MIVYMQKDTDYKVFGVGVLNDSLTNFTYKIRFPFSPRNDDRKTDWNDWKTKYSDQMFSVLNIFSLIFYIIFKFYYKV